MKQKYPFTGRVRYRKKSYEAEYNLARESLAKSNLTVIAQNETIRSLERIIAELRATNRERMVTIRNLQSAINGDNKPTKFSICKDREKKPIEKISVKNNYTRNQAKNLTN